MTFPHEESVARRNPLSASVLGVAVDMVLILGVGMHYLVLGLPGLSYPENKLGFPASGWPELAVKIETVVQEVERETGVRPLVVGMNAGRLSSLLAFYRSRAMARGGVKNTGAAALDTAGPSLFGPKSHMYELWFPSRKPYRDRPLILVGDEEKQLDVHPKRRRAGPIRKLTTEKNGHVTWRVYYRILDRVRNKKRNVARSAG